MKILYLLYKKVGISGIIIIVVLLILAITGLIQNFNLKKNAIYTYGIVSGLSNGSKGSRYLDYFFKIEGKKVTGAVPIEFCKECHNCCDIGDTVIVRYNRDDPENNDLVARLPDGEILE